MRPVVIFIVIFAIIILLAVGFFIFWSQASYSFEFPPQSGQPEGATVGFLFSCVDNPCAQGLTCDSGTVTCRIEDGLPCLSFSDCVTGSYCSGICVTGPNGALKQPCPCNSGLECVLSPEGPPQALICLGGPMFPCTNNSDCVSQVCENNVCSPGNPAAAECRDTQCAQNLVCDVFQFCQAPGVTSGNIGAACRPNEPPPGTSATAPFAGCNPGLVCFDNICRGASAGLGNNCGTNLQCAPPLACVNPDTGSACFNQSGGNCLCRFPDNSNTCPLNVCMPGFFCDIPSGLCEGNTGAQSGCIVNADCISNICVNNNSIYTLSSPPGSILGATGLRWIKQSTFPSTLLKLTGYSFDENTEIIYGLGTDGLYTYESTINIWFKVLSSPQIVTKQSMTYQMTIIDAVAKPNLFLIAFTEVQTGTMQTNNTVYSVTFSGNIILTPFNVINNPPNLPGTQYDSMMNEILIDSIDVSLNSDVMLLQGTTPYFKTSAATTYTLRNYTDGDTITGQPVTNVENVQFYYDIPQIGPTGATINFTSDYNFGYVAPFIADSFNHGNLLQFNGNISGAIFPTVRFSLDVFQVTSYSIFSPNNLGMQASTISFIALDQSIGAYFPYVALNGSTFKLPGFVNNTSQTLVTENTVYLSTPGSCG